MTRGHRFRGWLAFALAIMVAVGVAPARGQSIGLDGTGWGIDASTAIGEPRIPRSLLGFVPVLGAIPDLINAGIYAAEGDVGMALLSVTAAVPIVGDAVGVGKLALKYGDNVIGAVAHYGDEAVEIAAGAAMRRVDDVIIDTNAVLNRPGVEGARKAGERPVITDTVTKELQDIVARGKVKAMPRYAKDLEVTDDVMVVDARINNRAAIKAKPGSRGLFGDGAIGATAMRRGTPVITNDRPFAKARGDFGVEVRIP